MQSNYCKLKQNANEGCNSCASLAGLVLCFIACFILLCDRSFSRVGLSAVLELFNNSYRVSSAAQAVESRHTRVCGCGVWTGQDPPRSHCCRRQCHSPQKFQISELEKAYFCKLLSDKYSNHRLNGSSSPVLTATCLSYGSL